MRRNFWAISVSILSVLLLASCQDSIIPVKFKEKEELQGTLRIGLFGGNMWRNKPYEAGSSGFYQLQEKMIQFVKLNPKVNLEIIDVDYGNNFNSLMAKEGELPDIVELNPNEVRYSAGQVIENLTERIERKLPDWEGAYAELIDTARLQGEAFLLPIRSDPLVVYYNQTTLDKLNIQAPQDGWTWESYAQMAEKLNKANIPVGIPFDLNSIEPAVNSFGGSLSSPNSGKAVGYLDSEATVSAFNRFLKQMPKLTDMLIQPKQQPGLGFARASYLLGLLGDQQSDYRLASMPVSVDGTKHNNSLLTGLAISKDSANKELAWKLLQFIAGDSSDSAMSFVLDNTLRMQDPTPIIEQSKWQELVELVKQEVVNAIPASYDMVIGRSGSYGNGQFPLRSIEQLDSIREGGAKQLLEEWARDIDAGIPAMYK